MPRPSRKRTRLALAVSAATLLVSACANDGERATPGPELDVQLVASLQPFDACDDFLSYVKEQGAERVGAYGLDGGVTYYGDEFLPVAGAAEDMAISSEASGDSGTARQESTSANTTAAPMAADGDAAGAGADGTGTNNQEAGVDEADVVKTDGTRIVTVRNNELVVVTLTGGAPYVTAKLTLGSFSGDRLFLLPDRAYVLGYDNGLDGAEGADKRSSYSVGRSAIVEVSLTGEQPVVAHRTTIDGNILDGRLANGALRLVLTTPGGTGLGFVYPSDGDERAFERAKETNRKVLEESELDDWLPSASTDGGDRTPLLDCDHLYRPSEPSGFSMLSILTIADGLGSLTGSGVLSDGQTTYASDDHLYVATNRWDDGQVPDGAKSERAPGSTAQHTDVHSFSIAGTEPAAYEASGRVDGHVLNQYSMSQSAAGDLRIATTVDAGGGVATPMPMPVDCPPDANCPISGAVEDSSTSTTAAAAQGDSRIVVLRRDGDALKEVGKLGGLGATEQIKSVRYVGDTAYVVTFRRTDPFYVVDLGDPTSPKVLGELKVPGFSSYLHPVGDHLVLGVGSDATAEGRVTGAKLSLYDTTDPVSPKEIANWTSKDLGFMVDGDPHAFSWDAERQTAYLPYYGSCFDEFARCAAPTNGVMVVRVADGTITDLGRITHDDRTPSPTPAPEETTTTTTPETTTTVPEELTTTVPDGTTTTTVGEPATTTIPVTTVPTTVPATGTGSGVSGSSAPSTEVAPTPGRDIFCDPAMCDPGPVDYQPTIIRVFVLGDRIITLSDFGIAAHDVNDRHLIGFAAF